MSGNGPHSEVPMYFEVEVDPLERDDDEEEDDKIHFNKDDDLIPESSSSTARVYDRTTVLIERDPIRLDEEGEEEGHCGGEEDGVTFLTEGEGDGDEEGALTFMNDPDSMSQGYVHHTISPDQIQFTINPGSTPMPRNIEGATLTLHSECPETKQREVSTYTFYFEGLVYLHMCSSFKKQLPFVLWFGLWSNLKSRMQWCLVGFVCLIARLGLGLGG